MSDLDIYHSQKVRGIVEKLLAENASLKAKLDVCHKDNFESMTVVMAVEGMNQKLRTKLDETLGVIEGLSNRHDYNCNTPDGETECDCHSKFAKEALEKIREVPK